MNEPAITAEDLALYALQSLDGTTSSRVDLLLRSSSEARAELSKIRGDLAVLALSAPQHTPPSLSRQRLMKQVAREQRAISFPVDAEQHIPFAVDTHPAADPLLPQRSRSADDRRNRVRLPRIVSEPEPMFSAEDEAAHDPAPAGERRFSASVTPPRDSQPELRSSERSPSQEKAAPPAAPTASSPAESPELNLRPIRSSSVEHASAVAAEPALLPVEADDAGDRYTPAKPLIFANAEAMVERPSRTPVVMAWAGWVAAAGLAAATVFAVRNNVTLHQQIRSQQIALTQTRAAAARANVVLQTIESPASQRFVLARQDTAPVPSARVAYLADGGSLVFTGTNLDPLPAYKTYELWLIPSGEGRQPIPAGTFKPDARGYATLVMPTLPRGTVAGNFGVTVEDETGSATPTLPILLIGQQG